MVNTNTRAVVGMMATLVLGCALGFEYRMRTALVVAPIQEVAQESQDMGPKYLENFPGITCVPTIYSDIQDARSGLTFTDEKLAGMKLRDIAMETCSTGTASGESIILVGKTPNGWGQTNNWEVLYTKFGLVAKTIPFKSALKFGNTDDVPMCLFVSQNKTDGDGAKMPSVFHIHCRSSDLKTMNVTGDQEFEIDLAKGTAELKKK